MKYNEFSYYRANPFHKQGYLPDISLFNRKERESYGEIPAGDEFFTQSGRKHFRGKFNHSEIDQTNILKSPQKYPFENRIALNKDYRRNLDTIDIEGAASSTRVSQAVKNKFRARQQLARRYNQTVEVPQNKEKTYQQKKRQIAQRQYESMETRKRNNSIESADSLQKSKVSQNPQISNKYQQQKTPGGISLEYKKYVMQNSNNKYQKFTPRDYQPEQAKPLTDYRSLEFVRQSSDNTHTHNSHSQNSNGQTNDRESSREQSYQSQAQALKYNEYLRRKGAQRDNLEREEQMKQSIGVNNRFKSNPEYTQNYDVEFNRRREQQMKTNEYEERLRNKNIDKKQFRKNNPTNLSVSFNLAAQSIVSNQL